MSLQLHHHRAIPNLSLFDWHPERAVERLSDLVDVERVDKPNSRGAPAKRDRTNNRDSPGFGWR